MASLSPRWGVCPGPFNVTVAWRSSAAQAGPANYGCRGAFVPILFMEQPWLEATQPGARQVFNDAAQRRDRSRQGFLAGKMVLAKSALRWYHDCEGLRAAELGARPQAWPVTGSLTMQIGRSKAIAALAGGVLVLVIVCGLMFSRAAVEGDTAKQRIASICRLADERPWVRARP